MRNTPPVVFDSKIYHTATRIPAETVHSSNSRKIMSHQPTTILTFFSVILTEKKNLVFIHSSRKRIVVIINSLSTMQICSRWHCKIFLFFGENSVPVIYIQCLHVPSPPMENSEDNDLTSITALLNTSHCRDNWIVKDQLFTHPPPPHPPPNTMKNKNWTNIKS